MGWWVFIILVLLVLYNCSSPVTYRADSDHGPEKCNRASCWDNKSGRFIGANEWDKKQIDR